MKKIVLSVLVAGSLLATSCKEVTKGASDLKNATVETAGSAVDATTNAAGAVVDGAKDAAGSAVDATTNAADAVANGAKDAAGAVVDKASEMVSSALGGVSIPSFANEAVTENLTKYAAYAKDYIAANGNVAKIAALAPKGAELLAKGKELASTLNVQDMAKYKSVLSAIQSKMAPAK
jgi:phage-related protein